MAHMLGDNEKLREFFHGPLTNFLERLNGEDGDIWLDRFNVFLRGKNPYCVKNYGTWKSIKIGIFGSVKKLQEAILAPCFMGDYGKSLLQALDLYPLPWEVKLIRVSVKELGFEKKASLKEILAKAKTMDLGVCPPETGPYLRIRYLDQPHGEKIAIAMTPLPYNTLTAKNIPSIFMLENNHNCLSLTGERADGCCKFEPKQRFIFVRRRPTPKKI